MIRLASSTPLKAENKNSGRVKTCAVVRGETL